MKTLLYLGNRLSNHGITPTTIETLGPLLEKQYKVFYASRIWNPVLRLLDMIRVFLFQSHRADYIIIDTYSSNAFYFAWTIAQLSRLFGKKYIPYLHGGGLPTRLKNNPRLSKMIFNHSFINISPSGYLKAVFDASGFKAEVIPNFIEVKNYPYCHRGTLKPNILWVRSFHRQYNPSLAIEVFHQLVKKYPDAGMCMVGPDKDGSLEDCRKLAVKLGLQDKIRFTGILSREEWINLAADYSIFLNTTNFDNMPVSIIEAMALGLPVISTNVGGIPYLIENGINGLLVPPAETAAMLDAVEQLLTTPGLAGKLSENARKKAEGFDAGAILEKWKALLS